MRDQETTKRMLFAEAQEQFTAMRVAEACRLFTAAEAAGYDPDECAGARWACHALRGDFEAAWRESDAIAQRGRPDPNRFWEGRPFRGQRVLVRCLHGLGDTLQYLRYLPLVRSEAASLTIETQPLLKSLVGESGLADVVITWGDAEPAWDSQVEIVELPRIYRTTLASIPLGIPYIHVADTLQNGWRLQSGMRKVGLVWTSGAFNPARSLPLGELARLFDVPGISFFSFQAGKERAELAPWSSRVVDLYTEGQSVLQTAISLQQMDLLITVDTMMAHLAGAMGRPVWTLLPFCCDWRWMVDRADSPWYPTMRLFRQPAAGDWLSVIGQVRIALQAWSPGSTK